MLPKDSGMICSAVLEVEESALQKMQCIEILASVFSYDFEVHASGAQVAQLFLERNLPPFYPNLSGS